MNLLREVKPHQIYAAEILPIRTKRIVFVWMRSCRLLTSYVRMTGSRRYVANALG
ncbi:MAG: hypothetical protein ACLU4N_00420 [Butyricimonas faecihominis]